MSKRKRKSMSKMSHSMDASRAHLIPSLQCQLLTYSGTFAVKLAGCEQ